MKTLFTLIAIVFLLIESCNFKSENKASSDLVDTLIPIKQKNELSNKKDTCNLLNKKILGIWWSTDTSAPSAAFEISKNNVFYVDQMKYCRYKIEDDSIKINYEKAWNESYLIKFIGLDTLILINNNSDTFHRGK